jgi:hypothetical protein
VVDRLAQQPARRPMDLGQRAQQMLAFGRGEVAGDLFFHGSELGFDRLAKRPPRVGEPEPDEAVVLIVPAPGEQPGFAVVLCRSRNSGIAASGDARDRTAASGRRLCRHGRLTANHLPANVRPKT